MSYRKHFKLEGVIPATLLSFNDDMSINEKESRSHIKSCGLTDGITAITVNGHSSCLLYTSPSPRDLYRSRMPSSA